MNSSFKLSSPSSYLDLGVPSSLSRPFPEDHRVKLFIQPTLRGLKNRPCSTPPERLVVEPYAVSIHTQRNKAPSDSALEEAPPSCFDKAPKRTGERYLDEEETPEPEPKRSKVMIYQYVQPRISSTAPQTSVSTNQKEKRHSYKSEDASEAWIKLSSGQMLRVPKRMLPNIQLLKERAQASSLPQATVALTPLSPATVSKVMDRGPSSPAFPLPSSIKKQPPMFIKKTAAPPPPPLKNIHQPTYKKSLPKVVSLHPTNAKAPSGNVIMKPIMMEKPLSPFLVNSSSPSHIIALKTQDKNGKVIYLKSVPNQKLPSSPSTRFIVTPNNQKKIIGSLPVVAGGGGLQLPLKIVKSTPVVSSIALPSAPSVTPSHSAPLLVRRMIPSEHTKAPPASSLMIGNQVTQAKAQANGSPPINGKYRDIMKLPPTVKHVLSGMSSTEDHKSSRRCIRVEDNSSTNELHCHHDISSSSPPRGAKLSNVIWGIPKMQETAAAGEHVLSGKLTMTTTTTTATTPTTTTNVDKEIPKLLLIQQPQLLPPRKQKKEAFAILKSNKHEVIERKEGTPPAKILQTVPNNVSPKITNMDDEEIMFNHFPSPKKDTLSNMIDIKRDVRKEGCSIVLSSPTNNKLETTNKYYEDIQTIQNNNKDGRFPNTIDEYDTFKESLSPKKKKMKNTVSEVIKTLDKGVNEETTVQQESTLARTMNEKAVIIPIKKKCFKDQNTLPRPLKNECGERSKTIPEKEASLSANNHSETKEISLPLEKVQGENTNNQIKDDIPVISPMTTNKHSKKKVIELSNAGNNKGITHRMKSPHKPEEDDIKPSKNEDTIGKTTDQPGTVKDDVHVPHSISLKKKKTLDSKSPQKRKEEGNQVVQHPSRRVDKVSSKKIIGNESKVSSITKKAVVQTKNTSEGELTKEISILQFPINEDSISSTTNKAVVLAKKKSENEATKEMPVPQSPSKDGVSSPTKEAISLVKKYPGDKVTEDISAPHSPNTAFSITKNHVAQTKNKPVELKKETLQTLSIDTASTNWKKRRLERKELKPESPRNIANFDPNKCKESIGTIISSSIVSPDELKSEFKNMRRRKTHLKPLPSIVSKKSKMKNLRKRKAIAQKAKKNDLQSILADKSSFWLDEALPPGWYVHSCFNPASKKLITYHVTPDGIRLRPGKELFEYLEHGVVPYGKRQQTEPVTVPLLKNMPVRRAVLLIQPL